MYILLKYNNLRAEMVFWHEESITYATGFEDLGSLEIGLRDRS